MFVAVRQFASASGFKEIEAWRVRLPRGARTAPDGTTAYPATVWAKGALLVLGGYFVSTCGVVWSRMNNLYKPLSINEKNRVSLTIEGKQRGFYSYRIVASTFLSGIRHAGQNQVDHIDINTKNNALENLRWATSTQNASNKCPAKKKAAGQRTSDLCSRPIQQLDDDGNVLAEYLSATAAEAALKLQNIRISSSNISKVIAGKRPTAGGFAWQFAPREMTLQKFKSRGFEVVGGIEEAPHFYFAADLYVYNDSIGKMYETPISPNMTYPMIRIGRSTRLIHVVVAALRAGYKSLAAFDEYCAARLRDDGVTVAVTHDGDADKKNFWYCKIETQKENALAAVRNGCNTGKSAARAIKICLVCDAASPAWKYDGVRDAEFPSSAAAARELEEYSDLKNLAAGILQSARTVCSFSLVDGVKAWAFFV